jgi:hypothetical protein
MRIVRITERKVIGENGPARLISRKWCSIEELKTELLIRGETVEAVEAVDRLEVGEGGVVRRMAAGQPDAENHLRFTIHEAIEIGKVGPYTFLEDPIRGDESTLLVVIGKVVAPSAYWELPTLEELTD